MFDAGHLDVRDINFSNYLYYYMDLLIITLHNFIITIIRSVAIVWFQHFTCTYSYPCPQALLLTSYCFMLLCTIKNIHLLSM